MSALDRVGALSGAAFVVLGNIGNTLHSSVVVDGPTGKAILDSYGRLAVSPAAQAGYGLELIAWMLLLVFVSYVYSLGRGAGWLAIAGVAGGVTAVAIKVGSASFDIATYILRDSMDPATALALAKMSLVAFMIFTLPIGLFLVAGAGAAMITHGVGPVIGWSGVAIGAACIAFAAVSGPRIESGFSPTFLVAFVWILIVSLVWGFSRSRRAPTREDIPAAVA
jgi:hypothetical protein